MLLNGSTAIDGLSARSRGAPARRRVPARSGVGAAARCATDRVVDPVGAHRFGDVLDLLLAEVVEGRGQALADRALHRVGHRDATRLGQALEAAAMLTPSP
jgi:hypothetical protein